MDTPTKYDNRHISAVPAAAFLASVVADTASPPPPPPPPPQRKPSNLLTFLFPGSQSQNNLKTSPSPRTAFFFSPLSLSSAKIPPQVYCSINPFTSYNPTTTHWSSLFLHTDATLRRAKFDARRAENCAAIEAPRSASVFFVRSRHGEATLVVSSFYMALRKPLFPPLPQKGP
jgi:hypothetical protein